MVKSPYKVCAFCGQTGGGELGGLQNTSDRTILAHYNCLIFSPLVFTTDSEDDPKFVISSVLAEIKRGKSLKCSYCKQHGATIGCEVKRCQKTYHYECVEKDNGIRDNEQYHVYCSKHTHEANKDDSLQETKRSKTSRRPTTSKEMAKCSYCKKKGATIGCVIETCRKMYHLLCVEEDEGILNDVGDDQHVAYCFKHAEKHSDTPEEAEWSGSERPSTSYSPRPTVKRTRTSTPRNYSSPRGKKNAEQDTDSSGSSENPSTSFGTGPSTRNRNSDQSDYSPQLPNKKRSTAQEVESSSSASEDTPVRKMKRTSNPRQIFKQNAKRTRRTKDNLEDQQTDANDASNEATLKTTMSASSVKPGARRGRPPSKKKRRESASKQKKRKTVASVDSEDIQQSDGDAETEEMNAQTSGEEIEVDVQASEVEREKVDAQARIADREEITAEVESHKERTTPLSQHTLNDTCIPSTSQARFDVNELYFTKLYESQCKIANSIESGVSEFRDFAQQFQTLFKQFLDICQSLNHGICSNLTNAHEQTTSADIHHRPDATPDLLPLSHANSHIAPSTDDSANDADTNIDLLSSENTPTSDAKEPSRKTSDRANDADPNIETLSSENTPANDAKEQSRKTDDSANDADPNIDTLSMEIAPTNDAKGQSRKTNGSANDADLTIDAISSENSPTNDAKEPYRKTRSSLSGKRKRR
ncbi:uncharacterized protein LOC143984011 isoform X2 [Lithobates pipiens]